MAPQTEQTHVFVHGGEKKLTAPDYGAPIRSTAFADKWATGDLTADYPEYPYTHHGAAQPRGVVYTQLEGAHDPRHWGQRKLLLTEIDFLNGLPKEPSIVVYAGAADGRHMPILVTMFPHVEFHLYDPRPFYPGIDGHPNIRLNPYYGGSVSTAKIHRDCRSASELRTQNGWFTDEVAAWYATDEGRVCMRTENERTKLKSCSIYFISDIRTVPTEEEIERNQRQQEQWIRIMRPHMSMLKYKCPYPKVGTARTYRYMAGRVRLQCWAPVTSAETRLIVTGKTAVLRSKTKDPFPDKEWDVVRWERNMTWYNWVMRGHDFSTAPLRDFIALTSDETVRAFWSSFVPDTTRLGWDFVYELQILAASLGSEVTIDALRELVTRINATLISRGAHFQNYLTGRTNDK